MQGKPAAQAGFPVFRRLRRLNSSMPRGLIFPPPAGFPAGSPEIARFDLPVGVPDLHRHVLAAADDALTIGAEDHAVDLARVPLERQDLAALARIPHLHGRVEAGPGDPLAIGADGHTVDYFVCPLDADHLLPRGRVP